MYLPLIWRVGGEICLLIALCLVRLYCKLSSAGHDKNRLSRVKAFAGIDHEELLNPYYFNFLKGKMGQTAPKARCLKAALIFRFFEF